jgi:hypothetical protein
MQTEFISCGLYLWKLAFWAIFMVMSMLDWLGMIHSCVAFKRKLLRKWILWSAKPKQPNKLLQNLVTKRNGWCVWTHKTWFWKKWPPQRHIEFYFSWITSMSHYFKQYYALCYNNTQACYTSIPKFYNYAIMIHKPAIQVYAKHYRTF